ncbi:hypothetical protein N0V88_004444 [Collariella sp. IMI 366227]|nr:hypothetical protein N0V88_004444 [Collariella sp. IMI 366227]
MAQHGFSIGGHSGIDPNDLDMSGNYQPTYQPNFNHSNPPNAYPSNSMFDDDELLDGLPSESAGGIPGHGQDYNNGMAEIALSYNNNGQGIFGSSHHGLSIEQHHVNGFSSTPDGDPIQSPFVHSFSHFRQLQHPPSFAGSMKSPLSYAGSPLATADLNDSNDQLLMRNRMVAQNMQRQPSSTRGSLTPKSATLSGLPIGSEPGYGSQPIRTAGAHHEKTHSGQWMQTPNSIASFPGSGFASSPMGPSLQNPNINDIMKGGASVPAKLSGSVPPVSTQEARRKRRRESHNLVERRRRDNINDRIQDLSKLVPAHRLEDEKIRKAIQNGTPLSPTLVGIGAPSQATSSLAGPGARRAAGSAGNITTGLPVEEKDKGPNKGDILNGAVSWTRDLMWLLRLKIQQQEELVNAILERGGTLPFAFSDDERRMQSELMDAMAKMDEPTNDQRTFSYTRTAGSGLRVPHHTDYKGEPLNANGTSIDHSSVSPGAHGMLNSGEFLDFVEDDEEDMDITA